MLVDLMMLVCIPAMFVGGPAIIAVILEALDKR